jgi:hypothetical protein
MILVSTLYYEKIIDFGVYALSYLVIFVFIYASLRYMNKQNSMHLKRICGLVDRIEKGEMLPSINELRKQ